MSKAEMKDYFNSKAEVWDANCHRDIRKLKLIAYLADIKEGSNVIDIGCGTGIMTDHILEYNPSHLLGVDISEGMVDIAKSKFSDPRLEFITADIFDLEGDDFDLAIIYNAYPHFLDKDQLAQRLYRLLKPGGRFLIAHGDSKEKINSIHNGKAEVCKLSTKLNPVETERDWFSNLFNIDIMIDTETLYILSGIKNV